MASGGGSSAGGSACGGSSFGGVITLYGDDGATYIGSHMDSFGASGRVAAGTVIGTVGDSGNAKVSANQGIGKVEGGKIKVFDCQVARTGLNAVEARGSFETALAAGGNDNISVILARPRLD